MAKVNKSKYAILSMLIKRSLCGYDLKQILQHISRLYWNESNAQIYTNLKLLEEETLVTSQLDLKSGGREKRVYSITEAGKQALLEWLKQPINLSPPREEVLLKLTNAFLLPKKDVQNILQDYQKQIESEFQYYQATVQHVRDDLGAREDVSCIELNLDFVRRMLEAKLAWAASTVKKIALRE